MKSAFLGLLLATFLFASGADAYHSEDDRQTDYTARTLGGQKWRIGLFQTEYGIVDQLSVGIYNASWLFIPITGSFNASVYAKWNFLNLGKWSFAARGTFFYSQVRNSDPTGEDDANFNATVIPLELSIGRDFGSDWTWTLQSTWVQTLVNLKAESGSSDVLGAGAQSNLQFALNGEWRITKVFALNLVTRYVPYVQAARIKSEAESGSSRVIIDAEIDFEDIAGGVMIQPGVAFSWKNFNFHAGLGFGNLWIPGLRLVAGQRLPTPDLALFFRF